MKTLVAIVGIILLMFFLSLFTTFLWFCFDDKLAEVTGVAELGRIPWYNVWPFTFFVSTLFKQSSGSSGSKS